GIGLAARDVVARARRAAHGLGRAPRLVGATHVVPRGGGRAAAALARGRFTRGVARHRRGHRRRAVAGVRAASAGGPGTRVARHRGDRAEAVRRLEAMRSMVHGEARAQVALDLAKALREARRFDEGLVAAGRDLKAARQPGLRAQLRLERARLLRDAGRRAEALRAYVARERAETPG